MNEFLHQAIDRTLLEKKWLELTGVTRSVAAQLTNQELAEEVQKRTLATRYAIQTGHPYASLLELPECEIARIFESLDWVIITFLHDYFKDERHYSYSKLYRLCSEKLKGLEKRVDEQEQLKKQLIQPKTTERDRIV